MTLRDHLHEARRQLTAAGIPGDEAARDAALLACHVLGWDRARLIVGEPDPAPAPFADAYQRLIRRRAAREPVAYIRGVQEFYGRDFHVSSAVLIPRPETEFVVEEALACLGELDMPPAPRVVDVGTGSGCLAVTLALERPAAHLVGTDIEAAAIAVAGVNASRHGVSDRVVFRQGAYLAGLPGPLDVVVANPPYVAEADEDTLAPEVAAHEPRSALFGGRDGLRDIREVLRAGADRLRPGGWLVMEIGQGQAEAVRRLAGGLPDLTLMRMRDDLQGIPRVAVLQRRG